MFLFPVVHKYIEVIHLGTLLTTTNIGSWHVDLVCLAILPSGTLIRYKMWMARATLHCKDISEHNYLAEENFLYCSTGQWKNVQTTLFLKSTMYSKFNDKRIADTFRQLMNVSSNVKPNREFFATHKTWTCTCRKGAAGVTSSKPVNAVVLFTGGYTSHVPIFTHVASMFT